jgi:arginyl-tRNA synthetase
LAALKFADLSNHRASDYVFDIDKFTKFEGKTGPYLLYSAVRIKSILRNAAERNVSAGPIQPPTDAERNLMLVLSHLPDVLNEAAGGYLPHYLCDFAYALSQEFNRFYRDCHILNEQDKARQGSWMSLAGLVLGELELVLGLLGIEVPERM